MLVLKRKFRDIGGHDAGAHAKNPEKVLDRPQKSKTPTVLQRAPPQVNSPEEPEPPSPRKRPISLEKQLPEPIVDPKVESSESDDTIAAAPDISVPGRKKSKQKEAAEADSAVSSPDTEVAK